MGPILTPSVRVVFFDAVGTLIHPEPSAAWVYADMGRSFGTRLAPAEIGQRFRSAFQRQEAVDRAAGLRTNEERELRRWRDIVSEVLDDVTDPPACFQQLFEHFARPESWRLHPEAATVLAELRRRGLQLGLASNYDGRLRRVAAGLPGLAGLSHLVISSEVGWRKPAPAFYAAVCRAAGVPLEEIVHVGDDVDNDYEGARLAGLGAVLFDPSGRTLEGRVAIRRLTELL